MEVNILSQSHSVLNDFLRELRDTQIQGDRLRFRRNLQRIGSIMAYEVSRRLSYEPVEIRTPLAPMSVETVADKVVVGSILRAGMPMHEGVLDVFDRAENCFISAYRKYVRGDQFEIVLEYAATPSLEGKVLLLCDPMLATGSSLSLTYKALQKFGRPKHTHIMSIIGAREGVDTLTKAVGSDERCTLWVAAVDEALNEHKYIVPGLGDAGDLAYGEKM